MMGKNSKARQGTTTASNELAHAKLAEHAELV